MMTQIHAQGPVEITGPIEVAGPVVVGMLLPKSGPVIADGPSEV